jgi:hypothetical protein
MRHASAWRRLAQPPVDDGVMTRQPRMRMGAQRFFAAAGFGDLG